MEERFRDLFHALNGDSISLIGRYRMVPLGHFEGRPIVPALKLH
jgi:hypothetical protein